MTKLSDVELLRKAAYAAGYEVVTLNPASDEDDCPMYCTVRMPAPGAYLTEWNPIEDNRDAFELGVHMNIMFNGSLKTLYYKYLNEDKLEPDAAMRLAIVTLVSRILPKETMK